MTRKSGTVAFLLALVLVVTALSGCGKKQEEKNNLILDYASGTVATNDPDALQKAYDAAVKQANEDTITLNYRNDAYSRDGKHFSCYIGNSTANVDDLFVTIYADDAFSDELFMSGLLRPGTALDNIELNRKLDAGDHVVYVPFTQIQLIDGKQTIVGQAVVTMDFHVVEE